MSDSVNVQNRTVSSSTGTVGVSDVRDEEYSTATISGRKVQEEYVPSSDRPISLPPEIQAARDFFTIGDYAAALEQIMAFRDRIMALLTQVGSIVADKAHFDPNNPNIIIDLNAEFPAPQDLLNAMNGSQNSVNTLSQEKRDWDAKIKRWKALKAMGAGGTGHPQFGGYGGIGFPGMPGAQQGPTPQDMQELQTLDSEIKSKFFSVQQQQQAAGQPGMPPGWPGGMGYPGPFGRQPAYGQPGYGQQQGPAIEQMETTIMGNYDRRIGEQQAIVDEKKGRLQSYGVDFSRPDVAQQVAALPDTNPEHALRDLFPDLVNGDGRLEIGREWKAVEEAAKRLLNQLTEVALSGIKNIGALGDLLNAVVKMF